MGDTPCWSSVKDDELIFQVIPSSHAKYLGYCRGELEKITGDTHALVLPKIKNVDKTIRSWDERMPVYFEGESFDRSLAFLSLQYGGIFEDCVSSHEEISTAIDWSKSGGFPAILYGLYTKLELANDVNFDQWMSDFKPENREYTPIWMAKPKVEVLAKEDITRNKIRLFQIPPLHYLWYQHKYGLRSCQKLKNYKWSYYGFNPYRGGFHRLAQQLLSKKWRLCYDVSGWDKFLPVLRRVYEVVKDASKLSDEEAKEFEYVVNNLVDAILRMPNGQLFSKGYGNPSGSGTTTRDNILAHIVIFCDALQKAYYKKFGKYPSMSLLAEQIVAIFGDDMVASVDPEFNLVCDFKFLEEHFLSYGMKLKFLVSGENLPLEELSFLGAHFVYKEGFWMPLFNLERLAFSAVYDNTKEPCTLGQYLGKMRSLAFMAYPSEHFETFQTAFHTLLNRAQIFYQTGDLELDAMVNLGRLDPSAVLLHYTVWE